MSIPMLLHLGLAGSARCFGARCCDGALTVLTIIAAQPRRLLARLSPRWCWLGSRNRSAPSPCSACLVADGPRAADYIERLSTIREYSRGLGALALDAWPWRRYDPGPADPTPGIAIQDESPAPGQHQARRRRPSSRIRGSSKALYVVARREDRPAHQAQGRAGRRSDPVARAPGQHQAR